MILKRLKKSAVALFVLAAFATTGAWAGSMKSFDYDPKEILIGETITIEYETSKALSGNITITLGDYSKVYENYPVMALLGFHMRVLT